MELDCRSSIAFTDMTRRQQWRKVLDAEVARWSAMSCEQLVAALSDVQAYEVERDAKTYQVEVELLENTDKYVHVVVGVDDGSLPASLLPLTDTFIREKQS
jgi:hypothetical protein